MKILIIYTHPNPKSFNHAILEEVEAGLKEAGHEIKINDLYASGFKAVLDGDDFGQIMSGSTPDDIKKEQDAINRAEGLVFIYPIWWFSQPAILKGWLDRVFLPGFAFNQPAVGLLGRLQALVINTADGKEELYDKMNAKELISRPMTEGTLGFCGIKNVSHKAFFEVSQAGDEDRKAMLKEAKKISYETFAA